MRRATLLIRIALASLGLAAALVAPARAEVWGYVDERGVAHFAPERVDDRYELYFRGPGVGAASRAPGTPRAVAVPTAPPRLIAFFEISPNFRQVKQHLRDAASRHGVDYELLQALIATESGFDATAVSPRGAVGLMQVMPSTAQRYGVVADRRTPIERKLFDPKTNISAGTSYLRYLIDLFPGRLELALAAYNAGEGAVQRAGNRIPGYRETQDYVKTVMQLYEMLKPPTTVTASRAAPRGRGDPVVNVAAAVPRLAGGAVGRGNMPGSTSGAGAVLAASDVEFKIERD